MGNKLNKKASTNKGDCYYIKKDYLMAELWYRISAEDGNISAQNNLGWCYNLGKGVK